MKISKKLLVITLALLLAVTLIGCDNLLNNNQPEEVSPETQINQRLDDFFGSMVSKDKSKMSAVLDDSVTLIDRYESYTLTKEEIVTMFIFPQDVNVLESKFNNRVVSISNNTATVTGKWYSKAKFADGSTDTDNIYTTLKLIKKNNNWFISYFKMSGHVK